MRITRRQLRKLIKETVGEMRSEEAGDSPSKEQQYWKGQDPNRPTTPPKEVIDQVKDLLGNRNEYGPIGNILKGSGVIVAKIEASKDRSIAPRGWKVDITLDTLKDESLAKQIPNIISHYLSVPPGFQYGGLYEEPAEGYFSGNWKFIFRDGLIKEQMNVLNGGERPRRWSRGPETTLPQAIDDLGDELAGVNLMGLDARGYDNLAKWIASKLGLENYWTFMQQIGLDVHEWVAEELAPHVLKKFIDNKMSGSDLLKISGAMAEMARTGQFKGIWDRIISELQEETEQANPGWRGGTAEGDSLTLSLLRATGGTGRIASEVADAIVARVRYM